MDLALTLKRSHALKEERYFIEIFGSGRSLNVEELFQLMKLIRSELYRAGRLKDPTPLKDAWLKANRAKTVKAAIKWQKAHPEAVKAHNRKYGEKRKVMRKVARLQREAQHLTIKDIKAPVILTDGTHEVPEAETKRTLPTN